MKKLLIPLLALLLAACGPGIVPEPPAPDTPPQPAPGFRRVEAHVRTYCDEEPVAFEFQVIVTGSGLDGSERLLTRNGFTVPFGFMVRRVSTGGEFIQSLDYPADMDPTVVVFVATTGFIATRGCTAHLDIEEPGSRFLVPGLRRPDNMEIAEVFTEFGALVVRTTFMLPVPPRG